MLGLGWFFVEIRFIFDDGTRSALMMVLDRPRTIGLGYIQQLNYGPWHFFPFLCPAVYFLAALTARTTDRLSPVKLRPQCSVLSLSTTRLAQGWAGSVSPFSSS